MQSDVVPDSGLQVPLSVLIPLTAPAKLDVNKALTRIIAAGKFDLLAEDELVRQLRHHFGPSLRVVWALYRPTHAVYCALLGYHAYWMLIGTCDPML